MNGKCISLKILLLYITKLYICVSIWVDIIHYQQRKGTGNVCGERSEKLATNRKIDHSTIRQFDHSTFRPFDHSTIRPFDHSTIRPFDNSTIRQFDKSIIRPFDQSMTRRFDRAIMRNIYCTSVRTFEHLTNR